MLSLNLSKQTEQPEVLQQVDASTRPEQVEAKTAETAETAKKSIWERGKAFLNKFRSTKESSKTETAHSETPDKPEQPQIKKLQQEAIAKEAQLRWTVGDRINKAVHKVAAVGHKLAMSYFSKRQESLNTKATRAEGERDAAELASLEKMQSLYTANADKIRAMEQQLANLNGAIAQIETDSIQAKIGGLESRFEEFKNRPESEFTDMRRAEKIFKEKKSELEKEKAALQKEQARLEKEQQSKAKKIETSKIEQAKTAAKQSNKLENKAEAAGQKVIKIKGRAEAYGVNTTEAQEKVLGHENAVKELESKREQVEREQKETARLKAVAQADKRTTEALGAMKAIDQAETKERSTLQETLKRWEGTRATADAKALTISKEIKELEGRWEKHKSKLGEFEDLRQSEKIFKSKKSKLQTELSKQMAERNAAIKEMNKARDELQKLTRKYQDQRENLLKKSPSLELIVDEIIAKTEPTKSYGWRHAAARAFYEAVNYRSHDSLDQSRQDEFYEKFKKLLKKHNVLKEGVTEGVRAQMKNQAFLEELKRAFRDSASDKTLHPIEINVGSRD